MEMLQANVVSIARLSFPPLGSARQSPQIGRQRSGTVLLIIIHMTLAACFVTIGLHTKPERDLTPETWPCVPLSYPGSATVTLF